MALERDAARLYLLVGKRVRQRREEKHLSQEALARAVGLARTSITNLEKGRQNPPLHVLMRVADALKIELTELIPARAELAEGDVFVDLPSEIMGNRVTPKVQRIYDEFVTETPHDESPARRARRP